MQLDTSEVSAPVSSCPTCAHGSMHVQEVGPVYMGAVQCVRL